MRHFLSKRIAPTALPALAVLAFAALAQASNLGGGPPITSTVTIMENSELVGDVTCAVVNAPCIALGAQGITLKLNGFTITGRADPPTGCTPTADFFAHFEDGIDVVGQHDVAILGPGLVQKFARLGIFLENSTRVSVEGITASDNCFSGMFMDGTLDSDIAHNVWVRNAIGSANFPCGGT